MLGLRPDEDAIAAAVKAFDIRKLRRARILRRVFLLLLVLFVGAGAANLLGGRIASVEAESGGYRLQVSHAAVARPGQTADWEVELAHPGGFKDPVRLITDSSYLDLFDQSLVRPEPQSVTASGDHVVWTFDPPPGDALDVELEAQFDQDALGVHQGSTAVLGPDGDIVGVTYRTVVLP